MALTIALSAPFFVAFLTIPDLIMARRCSCAARSTRRPPRARPPCSPPMASGLPAVVLIRSAVASFQARGDTMTPMIDLARRRSPSTWL